MFVKYFTENSQEVAVLHRWLIDRGYVENYMSIKSCVYIVVDPEGKAFTWHNNLNLVFVSICQTQNMHSTINEIIRFETPPPISQFIP